MKPCVNAMGQAFALTRSGIVTSQLDELVQKYNGITEDMVAVKVSTVVHVGIKVDMEIHNFSDIAKLFKVLKNTLKKKLNIGYDEYFKHREVVRMFLDVDKPDDMPENKIIDISEIEYYFRAILTELFEFPRLKIVVLTSTEAVDKYRIYTNIAAPLKLCSRIADLLRHKLNNHNIHSKCVDLTPYSSGHLRLPMSFKVSPTTKNIAYRYYKTSKYEQFQSCVVQNIDDCYVVRDFGYFNPIVYFNDCAGVEQRIPCKIIEHMRNCGVIEYTSTIKKNRIDVHTSRPYKCPVTNTDHNRVGFSVYTYVDAHVIYCFSSSCKDKNYKITREDVPVEDVIKV